MDLLDECIKILKINSVSQTGNVEIVSYLNGLMNGLGLKTIIQSTTHRGVDQQNLVCQIEGVTTEQIIFNTHLDTVNPGDFMKWDSTDFNPFNPKIVGDRIYGLGSADTKLDFLCKLKALIKHKSKKFVNPLTFVGTYGEEMGLIGCGFFLNSGIVNPKYAFVGEPTNLNLVYAHKAMIVIRIELPLEKYSENIKTETFEFKGESAHGSTPHLGKNAIISAVNALKDLPQEYELVSIDGGSAVNMVPIDTKVVVTKNNVSYNRDNLQFIFDLLDETENKLYNDTDYAYDPPYSVLNIGTISTNSDKITMRMAFRMLPKRDFHVILKEIEEKLEPVRGKVILERNQPAMYTDKNGFLINKTYKILNELGIEAIKETKPASTEAALYQKWGADSVIFGPGISTNNIHKPNEYNFISQLYLAVSFYERVIEDFCLTEIK
ncbi:MAG: M20/M25/M40 family metallo-hydrolase [Spirochaetota bacterium]|nr:M20/M25/M40 family metallo-hydrolase [Spirochaetota bacterium]